MRPVFGKDQCRETGDRVVLRSAIPKGWAARTPARGTHAEYPGTAVEWDGRMLEVVEATAAGAGVRYVLLPWREDHVIRTLEQYDAASEQRRIEDFERAERQRRASAASRWSGFIFGHLPEPAQNRMQNELGVYPARMTILSCLPPLILFGFCIFDAVDAVMKRVPPRVPGAVTIAAALMMLESLIRFHLAMSQNRGMGSVLGAVVYTIYWALSPNRARLASPFGNKGESVTFTIAPSPDVARADSIEMFGPLLSLLPVADQEMLARTTGYDYRRHATTVTWVVLVFALLGVVTMYDEAGSGPAAFISFLLALVVTVEQLTRLRVLRTRPAPSIFGFAIRPILRRVLDDASRTVAD